MTIALRTRYLDLVFCRACLETPRALPKVPREPASNSGEHPQPQLHQLKRQLLHGALELTPDPKLFKRLCGAANEAAELAWATDYPLLVLPCLFEELADGVCASAS